MRRLVPALLTLSLAVISGGVAHSVAAAQGRTAESVMAGARKALGGDAKIAAVKTFIATGRTRQVRGENLVPIEFEIQAELPDKYSRRDEFPAQDAGPSTAGFVGDALVLIPRPVPPPPRPGAPAPPPGQMEGALRARMMTAKQDFARLMLGMFATSFPSFPLTYVHVGMAEAPQGKADVIEVKGPANFMARLFVADNGLPIMLTWTAPAPPGRGGPGGPGGPGGGPGGPLLARADLLPLRADLPAVRVAPRLRPNSACSSPTTARSMGCNSPSASGALPARKRRKKPRSIASASTRRSIRGDSTRPPGNVSFGLRFLCA